MHVLMLGQLTGKDYLQLLPEEGEFIAKGQSRRPRSRRLDQGRSHGPGPDSR